MNTSLRVERLFSLSDYNNVKFSHEVTDVPEKISLNPKGIGLLYSLMVLEMEKAHKNYIALYKRFPATMDQIDKTAAIIEEERTRTFTEFLNELNKE